MGPSARSGILALLGLVVAAFAHAADEPVTLREAKPVAHGIAAFPKIASPKTDAATHINRALEGADATVDRLAVDCKHYKGWKRNIDVTMRGPRYLGLVAHDDWFCGGAYPDTGTVALVYDLSTGKPVNWAAVVPKDFAVKAAPSPGGGVSDPILVESAKLWDLFAKASKNPDNADCDQVRKDPEGLDSRLSVWPDAGGDGIALAATEFPHAVRVCGLAVTVPSAELRKLGFDAALLDAIEEAHSRGWYENGAKK